MTFIGYCAVLNNQSHNLNYVACKALEGCPDRSYTFNESYNCKYVQFFPQDFHQLSLKLEHFNFNLKICFRMSLATEQRSLELLACFKF